NMIEEIKITCEETGQSVPETPGQIAKCVFDSLAVSYQQAIDQIEEIYEKEFKKINVIGGGSKNKMLNQLIADTTKKEVLAGPIEATAIGNLTSQLIATGKISGLSEARRIIKQSFEIKTYTTKKQTGGLNMSVEERYQIAKKQYEKWGINVEEIMEKLQTIPISIHCWQGDDIGGFETNQQELSGGIDVTGNYPGKATTPAELRSDLEKAMSLIPGKHRVNLHAIYGETDGEVVDRDELKPEHFENWVNWAKEHGLGLDFNPTLFSHEKSDDGLTLAHTNKEIRDFWIRHCIASRRIAEYFGKELGTPALTNIWIPDGYKDIPSDRLTPRKRLKDSLDEIFADEIDEKYNLDSVES